MLSLLAPDIVREIASFLDPLGFISLQGVCKKIYTDLEVTPKKNRSYLIFRNGEIRRLQWQPVFVLPSLQELASGGLLLDPNTLYEEALREKDSSLIRYLEQVTGVWRLPQSKFNYMRMKLTHITKEKLDVVMACYPPHIARKYIRLYYHGRLLGDYGDPKILEEILQDTGFTLQEEEDLRRGFFHGFLLAGNELQHLEGIPSMLQKYSLPEEPAYRFSKYQESLPFPFPQSKATFLARFLTDEELLTLITPEELIEYKRWDILGVREISPLMGKIITPEMILAAPEWVDLSKIETQPNWPNEVYRMILYSSLLHAGPKEWRKHRSYLVGGMIDFYIQEMLLKGKYKQLFTFFREAASVFGLNEDWLEEASINHPIVDYYISSYN